MTPEREQRGCGLRNTLDRCSRDPAALRCRTSGQLCSEFPAVFVMRALRCNGDRMGGWSKYEAAAL